MQSDTFDGSPYPNTIAPPHSTSAEYDPPTPGSDLGAVDYRRLPSAGMTDPHALDALSYSRDLPNTGGAAAGPPPDKTIQSFDLPDQLSSYDRMGRR